jgi:tetratricopeptide (TPR) repeat protein
VQKRSVPQPWRDELVAGLNALRNGEFSRAELHFERAYRHAPELPEICFALGRERLRRGRTGEAEELLAAAWSRDRSLVSAGATLARCVGIHLARMQDAHQILDEAEAIHGREPALEITRAELLVHEGRHAEAETRAARALAASEHDEGRAATRLAAQAVLARVENARGLARVEEGDLEAALFAFKRAADRDPMWGAPHVNSGAAFAEMGRHGPARAAYRRAIEADPTNPLAHYNLGLLLLRDGQLHEARGAIERALTLDPDDEVIVRAFAALSQHRDHGQDGGPDDGPGRRPPPLT